jgi:drug/metabolite transporter (DMT)-like permease
MKEITMKKGYIFICLAALGFGTEEIAGKYLASANMDPAQVMFLAFLVGAIVLCPLAIRQMRSRQLKLRAKDWAYLALEGILCVPISMFCLQLAVTHATAAKSAVVFCSNAIWTIPIAMWLLKVKVTRFDAIATAIAIVGVIVIYNPVSLIQGNSAPGNTIGMTYALIAAVTWAFFTVIGKKRIGEYGGYVFNFFAFAIGLVVLLGIILIQSARSCPASTPCRPF